jgi:hypothetical protein
MKTQLAALSIVILSISSVQAQNLLQDPSFDLSTPESQTNPHWTLDVDFPDGVGSAAQFQDAPWASNPTGTEGIGVWLKAFEGNQADGGDPPANATLYQEVMAPAGDYELSFFYRKETNYQAESTFVELLEDGSQIGLVDLTGVDTGGIFEQFSLNGSTAGGTLRVQAKMVNGTDAMANPQSAMFDDFNLAVVPEPSSSLLMVLGMAVLMLCRRRPESVSP